MLANFLEIGICPRTQRHYIIQYDSTVYILLYRRDNKGVGMACD